VERRHDPLPAPEPRPYKYSAHKHKYEVQDLYHRDRVLAVTQSTEGHAAKRQWDETLHGDRPSPGWTTRLGDIGPPLGITAIATGKLLELLGYRSNKRVTDTADADGCVGRSKDRPRLRSIHLTCPTMPQGHAGLLDHKPKGSSCGSQQWGPRVCELPSKRTLMWSRSKIWPALTSCPTRDD
jgi:hypothetical protein